MPDDPKLLFHQVDSQLSTDPSMPLHDLARNIGVDRHAIERATRHVADMTFRSYQKLKWLTLALTLLERRRDLEIREIAKMLRYRSPTAFSRFIKTMTGSVPRSIRGRP